MTRMQSRLVRVNVAGTVLFVAASAVAVPLKDDRWAQVLIGVVSIVLFAAGIVTSLWAYTQALERSRVQEVGVANLFLLTGPTAPSDVKRLMTAMLVLQVVVALVGASVGASGLGEGDVNALAFGWLVPMFGIGMNGAWAARYGSYGPRVDPTRPSKQNG